MCIRDRHITNEPLESYAKRTLFDKLGLESTSFVWTEKYDQQIATGHNADGNCKERKKYLHGNAAYTLYTTSNAVSYTHLRAHETVLDIVCRLLLEKKKNQLTKHMLGL